MDGYKHYIRTNEAGVIILGFSSAFEEPQAGDILILEDGPRHFQQAWPPLTNDKGQFIYKWDGTNRVPRTEDELITLDDVKNAKIDALNSQEAESLRTFQSSALGTPHTYVRVGVEDFSELFNAQFAWSNSPLYDGRLIPWYTVEQGNVNHTKEQFNQVYSDGFNHVGNTKYHRAILESQVKSATTVGTVNAIVW